MEGKSQIRNSDNSLTGKVISDYLVIVKLDDEFQSLTAVLYLIQFKEAHCRLYFSIDSSIDLFILTLDFTTVPMA